MFIIIINYCVVMYVFRQYVSSDDMSLKFFENFGKLNPWIRRIKKKCRKVLDAL